jgi:hypothetical protein
MFTDRDEVQLNEDDVLQARPETVQWNGWRGRDRVQHARVFTRRCKSLGAFRGEYSPKQACKCLNRDQISNIFKE